MAKKRGAGYVHCAPTKERTIRFFFFWRSLCICVRARLGKSREREQTDRRSRSNCVWLRELKKASRFASWSQRRRAGGKDSIDEERWRRCCCCYSPFFSFFFSRSALTRTHTRPPEAAKPSWERSNSGGLSLLLLLLLLLPFRPRLPHVTRATGARRAHRLSKALATPASTRAAFFFFLLDITWIPFFYFFSFFDALLSGERERISFVKILSPHQSSVVSFAEIFSQLPLDYLGFLIIHRLSLSLSRSILKMQSGLSIPLKVLDAVLSISISFSNATQSIFGDDFEGRKRERHMWSISVINAIIRLCHLNMISNREIYLGKVFWVWNLNSSQFVHHANKCWLTWWQASFVLLFSLLCSSSCRKLLP